MLDLALDQVDGKQVWISKTAPTALRLLQVPLSLTRAGQVTGTLREFDLEETLRTFRVQSMGHHARSVYLGRDTDGWHYFAKGVGFCLSPGWTPDRGNTGVLAGWAAERERDLSIALRGIGLRVPEPMAIYAYDWLPGTETGERWRASQVPDLDGTPARPSMYVYRHRARFRMADLPIVAPDRLTEVGDRYWPLMEELQRSVRTLHRHGGHDYSLSLHNVWEDGARVDFEYVVLEGHPHPIDDLNRSPDVWRGKEWSALRCLSFELADMVGLESDAAKLDLISGPEVKGD